MRHQHYSQSASTVPRMEASWIAALISNLHRHAQLLDQDIIAEQERAQVFDRSHPAYPILARTLTARRDNLSATIAALTSDLPAFRRFAETTRPLVRVWAGAPGVRAGFCKRAPADLSLLPVLGVALMR